MPPHLLRGRVQCATLAHRSPSRHECDFGPPSSFFFIDPAPPEIYTLSLHDALPIYSSPVPNAAMFKTSRTYSDSPGLKRDRKSTRLNSSHVAISYAVFCLKKKNRTTLPC